MAANIEAITTQLARLDAQIKEQEQIIANYKLHLKSLDHEALLWECYRYNVQHSIDGKVMKDFTLRCALILNKKYSLGNLELLGKRLELLEQLEGER